MNRSEFFAHYPGRKADSNKYDNGTVLFVSGSYGMAGAAILNIIGARSAGASYIHSVLPENIYPIAASREITAVYHPDNLENKDLMKNLGFLKKVKAIGIGSGFTNHPYKKEYLKDILEISDVPVIVDAEGLRVLSLNEDFYSLNKRMILTPHLGEFAALTRLETEEIKKDRENIAVNFAKKKGVILVLKDPQTLVINKDGDLYRNDSGNCALATAGSGDVLTGMITGLCALYNDTYQAVKDGVWLHGYLADEAMNKHSAEIFDLTEYPEYADAFFFRKRENKKQEDHKWTERKIM